MFCQKCGRELGEEMQFCPACGTRVVRLEEFSKLEELSKSKELSKPEVASSPEMPSKPEVAPKPEELSKSENPPKQTSGDNNALPKERLPENAEKKPDPFSGKTGAAIENKTGAATGANKPLGQSVHPYHSLGGFPMFLVVINYISGIGSFISVIVTLVQYIALFRIASYGGGAVTGFLAFSMLGAMGIGIASGIICLRFAVMLQRKNPGFLHTIQTGSLSLLIVSSVYYFIILIWAKSFDVFGLISTGSYITQWVLSALMWVASLIIMSTYFGKSVRVRTYMGSDEYLRRSLFNRNTVSPIPADGSADTSVKSPDTKTAPGSVSDKKNDFAMAKKPETVNKQPVVNEIKDLESRRMQKEVTFPESIVNDWQENEETRPLKMKQEEVLQSVKLESEGTKVFEPAKRSIPSAERISKVDVQPDPKAASAFSQITPVPAEQTTGHAFTMGVSQQPANNNAAQAQAPAAQTPSSGYVQTQQDASAYASYSDPPAYSGYTSNPQYSNNPGYAANPQYSDYSEYAAYPGFSNYQEYAAYEEQVQQQETTGIWKPLMLIGLIVGLLLIALAIVMVLMEAELGFVIGLGIAGLAVVIFGVVCAVKYVRSI